jgi:hypothetical protein
MKNSQTKIVDIKPSIDITTPAPAPTPWRDSLKVHPAANRIPLATAEERRVLDGDLRRCGQKVPVVLVRVAGGPPQLVDGRHRLDLQEGAGVQVVNVAGNVLVPHQIIDVADDKEAEALSLSLNAHRRHLKLEQRRQLIRDQLKENPRQSDRQIAEKVKASPTTVGKERTKMEATVHSGQLPKRVGRDGKARKQPTARKKAAAVAKAPTGEVRSNGGDPKLEANARKDEYAKDELAAEAETTPTTAPTEITPPTTEPTAENGAPAPTEIITDKAPRQVEKLADDGYPDFPPILLRTNPISAAWQSATAEQRRQFADEHGAAVIELMGGAGHARAA